MISRTTYMFECIRTVIYYLKFYSISGICTVHYVTFLIFNMLHLYLPTSLAVDSLFVKVYYYDYYLLPPTFPVYL